MHSKTTKTAKPRRAADDVTRPRPIDYGPAVDAIENLTRWAFKLAAKDVAGWPEGRQRVRNARRFVLGRLRGKAARDAGYDLVFVAGLLARIFEAELGLTQSAIVRLLDNLELPTDEVPRVTAQPTPWSGPVRRYPTPPPRTAAEEDKHWFTQMEPVDSDDEDDIEDELAARRACRAAPRRPAPRCARRVI